MADYEDGFIVALKEVYVRSKSPHRRLLVLFFSGSCTKSEENQIVRCF